MNRQELINWLESNDSDGCYSDEDCRAEGLAPLSLEYLQAYYNDQNEDELTLGNIDARLGHGFNH